MTKFAGLNEASGSNPKARRLACWCGFRGLVRSPVTCTSGRLGGARLTAPVRGARGPRTTPRGCATHCAQVTVKRCGDLAGAAGGPHSNCRDRVVRRSGIEGNEYSLPGVAFGKYWFLSPSAKQTGAADGPQTSRAAPPGAGSPAGPPEAVLCGRASPRPRPPHPAHRRLQHQRAFCAAIGFAEEEVRLTRPSTPPSQALRTRAARRGPGLRTRAAT